MYLRADEISDAHRAKVGGKAYALSVMHGRGITVPPFVSITTDAYERFVSETGLRSRIVLELHRKELHQMRWEEIWDTALRIRNAFLRTRLPPALEQRLAGLLSAEFGSRPVSVRSVSYTHLTLPTN